MLAIVLNVMANSGHRFSDKIMLGQGPSMFKKTIHPLDLLLAVLAAVTPGAIVDGPTLIEADMNHQIDNMEGLSLHRADDGALVLTLISDDNFSMIQRTILLQFTLAEP